MLNVLLTPKAGYIATDSFGYTADGSVRGQIAKCIALPHLTMAISSRGAAAFLWVFASFLTNAGLGDADEMTDRFPGLAQEVMDRTRDSLTDAGQADAQVAVIWWSNARKRPAGVWAEWREGDMESESIPELMPVSAPGFVPGYEPNWGRLLSRPDPAFLFRGVAECQQKMAAQLYPKHPVGGDLIITEVGPGVVRQFHAGRLPSMVTARSQHV